MSKPFQPGFRLSVTDIFIVVGGGAAAAAVWTFDQRLSISIAFVVLHFFLFCNVLRMSRPWNWCGPAPSSRSRGPLSAATSSHGRSCWPFPVR